MELNSRDSDNNKSFPS